MKSLGILVLSAAGLLLAPGAVAAKPTLFRAWGQVHGTLAGGQGNYFHVHDGPYLGFGGQLGVQLIVFEAYVDLNVFDLNRSDADAPATMWNQLALGLNFPIPLFASDKVKLFGRADVTFARAPYDASSDPDLGQTYGEGAGGIAGLAGGGIEYFPHRLIAVGAAAYGGYHIFGTRDAGDNGSHVIAQLYTRFELKL